MHLIREQSLKLSLFFSSGLIILPSIWIGLGVFQLSQLQMYMDEAVQARRGFDLNTATQREDWQTVMHELTKPNDTQLGTGYPSGFGYGCWDQRWKQPGFTARRGLPYQA